MGKKGEIFYHFYNNIYKSTTQFITAILIIPSLSLLFRASSEH